MHPTPGQIQAYHDGELSAAETEQVKTHLADCPACQKGAQVQAARADQVQHHLAMLEPQQSLSAQAARARLQTILNQQENQLMFQKLFAPRFRIAWAVAGVIAILAVAFTFPPVRAFANSFLGLFRVQQVTFVPFNPANMPSNVGVTEEQITQLLADNVQMVEVGEARSPVSAEEASAFAGIPVRLPQTSVTPALSAQPGVNLTAKVNLPRLRAILDELGRSDIQLPDALDGATLTAALPPSVTALYGDCSSATPGAGEDPDDPSTWATDCTALTQLTSPTISAPAGLDISAIGQAYLQMLGMSAEDAASFSTAIDWSSTLVMPIPNDASFQAVAIDGVTGSLIIQSSENTSNPRYLLIWVKDGILYALSGHGDPQMAIEMANSMK